MLNQVGASKIRSGYHEGVGKHHEGSINVLRKMLYETWPDGHRRTQVDASDNSAATSPFLVTSLVSWPAAWCSWGRVVDEARVRLSAGCTYALADFALAHKTITKASCLLFDSAALLLPFLQVPMSIFDSIQELQSSLHDSSTRLAIVQVSASQAAFDTISEVLLLINFADQF